MSISCIISFEELKKVTGLKTPTAVAVSLTKSGVHFFCGRGGRPWTTEAALNAALGLRSQTTEKQHKPKIDID